MGKPKKWSPWPQYRALAETNGVGYQTYLHRIKVQGLDPREAATRPVDTRARSPRTLGRPRSVRVPIELDAAVDEAIAASGKTQSEWIASIIEAHLKQAGAS